MIGKRWIAAGIAGGALLAAALLAYLLLTAVAAAADEPTTGTITIVLDASPNDAQDFAFTGCQGQWCGPFTLDDDADPTRSNTTTADLAPGTYTVTQDALPNWALSTLTCDTGETTNLATRRATIDLTAGEDVTCTFTNTSASITIIESSYVADPHDFSYTGCLGSGCGNFVLDDDSDPALPDRTGAAGLAPGTYVITQAADTNWSLTSITCTTAETVYLGNRTVTINLTAGEQQSCKFSNEPPSLAISQEATPSGTQAFDYTGCLGSGCAGFTLDWDSTTPTPSTQRSQVLATGTYVITQTAVPNWPLRSITCTNPETVDLANRRVTVVLRAGERQACTFRNISASLSLVEDTTPDGSQDVTLHRCLGDDCATVALDDDADVSTPAATGPIPLAPGTYTVTADEVPGYELAAITCTTGESVDLDARRLTVTLSAGEQQQCTFGHRLPPPHLTDVAQISAGAFGTCARLTNGQARCWGSNRDSGRIGDGSFDDHAVPSEVLRPDESGPLDGVASISTGHSHTCAALTSGQAVCWGHGGGGALGGGATETSAVPVTVSSSAGTGALTDVADVGAGADLSCALLSSGQVSCWGTNSSGQLGDGTTTTRLQPTSVTSPDATGPLTDVRQLSVGGSRVCAALGSGEARCWGENGTGAAGDGSTVDRTRPAIVSNRDGTGPLTGVAQVSTGGSHSCALLETGEGLCWGEGRRGQLGDGSLTSSSRPVVISNAEGTGPLTGIVELTVVGGQSCALVDAGIAYCWGISTSGALGDGTTSDRARPVRVADVSGTGSLDDIAHLAAGIDHTCALLNSGEARCWGSGAGGALGDGTTGVQRQRPVAVIDPSTALIPLTSVVETSAGGQHSCARTATGRVLCWGSNLFGQLGNVTTTLAPAAVAVSNVAGDGDLTGATAISAAQYHSCAQLADGTAVCWGNNQAGQIGDGTTTNRLRPVAVVDVSGTGSLTGITQTDAGSYHSCALLADTTIRCWGLNRFGALGDGTTTDRTRPVVVMDETGSTPMTGVTNISVGDEFTCARLTTGEARCWGRNDFGQLGDGTTTARIRPVVVSSPDDTGPIAEVSSVAAGSSHACALLNSGQARCWGFNGEGRLGDGTTTARIRAVVVSNPDGTGPLTGVSLLAAGSGRTCAVLEDETLTCWGGPLVGDGTESGRNRPTAVSNVYAGSVLDHVRQVDPGGSAICAALAEGQARCWGRNHTGAVGDGSAVPSGPESTDSRLRPRIVVVATG